MDDWKVGDLALCLHTRARKDVSYTAGGLQRLVKNRIYRVGALCICPTGVPSLVLEGVKSDSISGGFAAFRFRKIRPDEHEPCEAEFVTLLNRIKLPAAPVVAGGMDRG